MMSWRTFLCCVFQMELSMTTSSRSFIQDKVSITSWVWKLPMHRLCGVYYMEPLNACMIHAYLNLSADAMWETLCCSAWMRGMTITWCSQWAPHCTFCTQTAWMPSRCEQVMLLPAYTPSALVNWRSWLACIQYLQLSDLGIWSLAFSAGVTCILYVQLKYCRLPIIARSLSHAPWNLNLDLADVQCHCINAQNMN